MSNKRALQYSIYKGVGGKFGVLQFNFQSPHYYKDREKDFVGRLAVDDTGKLRDGWKQREGAVFIEAASAIGKNQYDWENKITFACSVDDMGKLIHSLTTSAELDIMHDPGANTERAGATRKHVKLFSKEGIAAGGCMLSVTEQNGEDRKEHKVPVSSSECIVLRQLLLTAVSRALAW